MYSSKSDFTDRWRNFAGRKCFARSDTHLYRQADICKHTLHFKICINASNVDRLNHRTACYNAKKKEITRAQAGNAWGPSAAHWRTDEIHISDSNLLLETKGCEGLRGKEFVPSLRAAYTIQLPHYVWTNSPKHLSLKHGFNSSAVNGFKLKSAIILCRHIAASSLAAVLKLLYYFSYNIFLLIHNWIGLVGSTAVITLACAPVGLIVIKKASKTKQNNTNLLA